MSSLAKNMKTLAAVVGFAAAGVATGAQAQTACGVQGIAGGNAATVYYDPFEPSGLQSTTVTMAITRINPGGGGKTSDLNFFIRANTGTGTYADGIQIIPRTFSGQGSMTGSGLNIFYDYDTPDPILTPITVLPTSNNRFLKVEFNGNPGQADTAIITFDVIMPANLNLNASRTLMFDAEFACKMQGGQYNNETQSGTRPNAMSFPVTVLSALRASYVGTALDFGEIGTVTNAEAPGRKIDGNSVRVESSGAYDIELKSENKFKLMRPDATTDLDKIGYKIKFLNQTRDPVANTPITATCGAAGIGESLAKNLYISAELVEGGSGKNPSETYRDNLIVTLTPRSYETTGSPCG